MNDSEKKTFLRSIIDGHTNINIEESREAQYKLMLAVRET